MAIADAIKNGILFLVFVFGVQSGIANDKAWQFDHSINDGCLFESMASSYSEIEQGIESTNVAIHSNNGKQNNAANLKSISNLISQGMVVAKNAAMSVVVEPIEAAELGVVISNSFDQNNAQDPYWQYYRDCDKWNVTFGSSGNVGNTALANSDSRRSLANSLVSVTKISNIHCRNLVEAIKGVQFSVLENINRIHSIQPPKTSSRFRLASWSRTKKTVSVKPNLLPSSEISMDSNFQDRKFSVQMIWKFKSTCQPFWSSLRQTNEFVSARFEIVRNFFGLVTNSSMCRVLYNL